ncbi:HAMP domain-containing sensor histidine kinase [Bacillus sp. REN10]|uniref:sensor histidine kinase n=1 Tax=Bacillus sp. REN10 TaxID=2782541 RepID=UPI00193B0382|nr:HAMP domain-containing sensor histidine kinase [Bacillus sp. REN10]
MDTKWRSSLKFIGWLLLFTYGLSAVIALVIHGSTYLKKDYFHTPQFEAQLDEFINGLNMYELNSLTAEEAKKRITVTKEEIEEYRNRYGSLSEQVTTIKKRYAERIQEALLAENQEVAKMYEEERDEKIKDITNNFKSEDHVRKKIQAEKEKAIDEFYVTHQNERRYFGDYEEVFKYYLKNTSTGDVHTNVNLSDDSLSDVFNDKDMLHVRKYDSPNYLEFDDSSMYTDKNLVSFTTGEIGMETGGYNIEIQTTTGGTYEGRIAVTKHVRDSAPVITDYSYFKRSQRNFAIFVISGLLALVVSLLISCKTTVIPSAISEKFGPYYNKVPIDMSVVTLMITTSMTFILLARYYNFYNYSNPLYVITDVLFIFLLSAIATAVVLFQAKLLLLRIKEGPGMEAEWKNSLFMKIIELVKNVFEVRSVGVQLFLLLLVLFFTGLGVPIVVMEWWDGYPSLLVTYLVLFSIITIPTLFLLFKRTAYFNQIVQYTARVAAGYSEPDLPVKGKSVFAKMAEDMNQLKQGVKASQREQAKSERLKTELITNVSHDLRTPLTSIISYTELLKTPNLGEEERAAYTEIIDRKSKRLKVLIDDLFEASKMASGNAELVKEKADLVQLLQQALAEYSEAIGESDLHFRVTNPDEPVYAYVDGQKIWRVFDNLIGNILKYSLENTRVYISMKTEGSQAVITFKNVTKYELGENLDELFERFKRGDRSRHTEGSGLGLAIAKSIIDLHEGQLDIEVDGDLFKVTVSLDTAY